MLHFISEIAIISTNLDKKNILLKVGNVFEKMEQAKALVFCYSTGKID